LADNFEILELGAQNHLSPLLDTTNPDMLNCAFGTGPLEELSPLGIGLSLFFGATKLALLEL
jgi:hypothetical protein